MQLHIKAKPDGSLRNAHFLKIRYLVRLIWARFHYRQFKGMVGVLASGLLPNTADASHRT
jgi:hypothetical protein